MLVFLFLMFYFPCIVSISFYVVFCLLGFCFVFFLFVFVFPFNFLFFQARALLTCLIVLDCQL